MDRVLILAAALLAGCASSAPPRTVRITRGQESREVVFEIQKLHGRAKAVTVTAEVAPDGRLSPPRIEPGEATVLYLHHLDPADSLGAGSVAWTILLALDHIPRTPCNFNLPEKGVEVLLFVRGFDGGRGDLAGAAVRGWIRVDEAADERVTGAFDVVVEARGARPEAAEVGLAGSFEAVR